MYQYVLLQIIAPINLVGREIRHNHHIQGFIHYEKGCGNITILYALRKK
jgi:hypothetical protein